MADPLAFVRHRRQLGADRPVAERVRDYHELHQGLAPAPLQVQASRCMSCSLPFCHHACPLHNLVPDWNALAAAADWRPALERLHRTNNFPEFTGRLCPAPCEASCVLAINDEPVAIKEIERSLIDRGLEQGWVRPQPPRRRSGRRVAVVGSGPAGLAAAQQLARAGHAVTVFEQAERPGGLLRFGIPDYKLPKRLVDGRIEQMEQEGVTFRCGVTVGSDLGWAGLLDGFDAVGLALGARQARELPIPGRALKGVHLAMDYLEQQNRRVAGFPTLITVQPISAGDRRVVILGGGDTGADCLGNVHREGCRSVIQLELLPRPPSERAPDNPWPQWPLVLRTSPAHEEGGERGFGVETVAFGGTRGEVAWLELRDVQMQVDAEGRRTMSPVAGSQRRLQADLVLLALGFVGVAERDPLGEWGVPCSPAGTLITDHAGRTPLPQVFAFGDAVRGASLVVHAIADGRDAARSIDSWLSTGAA